MPWLQIKLILRAEDVDYISTLLQQHGALSVTCSDAADQPIFEPGVNQTPLWRATELSALYPAEIHLGVLEAQLQAHSERPLPPLRVEPLQDQDWVRAWMEHYQPMDFGHGLWICPSHLPPPDPGATTVMLDPGLAFGTGTHPTTAMCLRLLAARPPRDAIVIDYGCGSGILALAAAKLGARQVYAIDTDPQALQATACNAVHNQVADRIRVGSPGELNLPSAQYLLANILAGPLIALAPMFATLLADGGTIVLSGILHDQHNDVQQAYRDHFLFSHTTQHEDWLALTGRRRPR
ncbi:MAG: 50S ribosomal protein L11 methyltransferase [Gammaproteobacteria bacterium]|nr:50S ribosomal protein L11 methyltransferase [Gammaproteobacteria bacterium]